MYIVLCLDPADSLPETRTPPIRYQSHSQNLLIVGCCPIPTHRHHRCWRSLPPQSTPRPAETKTIRIAPVRATGSQQLFQHPAACHQCHQPRSWVDHTHRQAETETKRAHCPNFCRLGCRFDSYKAHSGCASLVAWGG